MKREATSSNAMRGIHVASLREAGRDEAKRWLASINMNGCTPTVLGMDPRLRGQRVLTDFELGKR